MQGIACNAMGNIVQKAANRIMLASMLHNVPGSFGDAAEEKYIVCDVSWMEHVVQHIMERNMLHKVPWMEHVATNGTRDVTWI